MNTETGHHLITSPQVQISLSVHTQNCSHHCTQLQVLGRSLYCKMNYLFSFPKKYNILVHYRDFSKFFSIVAKIHKTYLCNIESVILKRYSKPYTVWAFTTKIQITLRLLKCHFIKRELLPKMYHKVASFFKSAEIIIKAAL